jgi:hypothetical protein
MTFNSPRDPHLDPNDPLSPRRPSAYGGWMPMVLAAVVAVLVLAMVYSRTVTVTERIGDTNAGPPVQTVAPTPAPSTSPAVPTPNPTTEPRPTQAPQP